MGVPGSANALLLKQAAAAGGYEISRSVRLSSSDGAYLSRSFGTAGSRTTWTWSGWIKRAKLGSFQHLFVASDFTSTTTLAILNSDDTIEFYDYQSGGYTTRLVTTQVFRDPGAWQHLQFTWDSNNGTSTDRMRIYVNGTRITTFSTATYPSPGVQTRWNNNVDHRIGTGNSTQYLDSYLAECYLIDGQALTPSSFTEVSATTGQLIPIAYTGSSGTNGFHLPFSDNSTAAALGTDTSGNSNTWTVNNISVTAGAGNDSLVDSPTSYGTGNSGGDVRGNYCTWNPLNLSGVSLSNGNLQALATSTEGQVYGTFKMPYDKIYFELTSITNGPGIVIGVAGNPPVTVGGSGRFRGFDGNSSGNIIGDNWVTLSSLGAGWAANDIIGIAYDGPSGSIKFYKNGSLVYTDTTINTTLDWFPWIHLNSVVSAACHLNWGQRAFAHTAPSGFKALCDTNLPEPTIADGSTVMDVALWTGTGATNAITGLGFAPDLVWIKKRSAAADHNLVDSVRVGTRPYLLYPNLTHAESTSYTLAVQSLDSAGFTLGTDGDINGSGATYAGWCWDAGSSTVSNTDGSITSQVRANASAGFSVVTWTAIASATIGHGLGVPPQLIIAKSRTSSGTDWVVYSSLFGRSSYLVLNGTNATGTLSNYWGTADPTSTVFGVYSTVGASNNAGNMVAYCFAPVAGYSSFGSYVGNGSSDGVFVYTGFRPRWLLIKTTSISGEIWVIKDSARGTYNPNDPNLYANLSIAEQTSNSPRYIDFLSNGFKLRGTEVSVNGSSNTYIYYAVAENPFQYARAR